MPQSTTQINACDVAVRLQTTEGDLLDISGSSNDVSIDFDQNIGERKTFGQDFPLRLVCGRDATVNLKAVYTTDSREAMMVLKDWYFNHYADRRRIQVDVPDDDPGSDRYQLDCLITTLRIPMVAGDADPILVEATLRPSGEFTWSVVAS